MELHISRLLIMSYNHACALWIPFSTWAVASILTRKSLLFTNVLSSNWWCKAISNCWHQRAIHGFWFWHGSYLYAIHCPMHTSVRYCVLGVSELKKAMPVFCETGNYDSQGTCLLSCLQWIHCLASSWYALQLDSQREIALVHLVWLLDFFHLAPIKMQSSNLKFILEGLYHTHVYYNSEWCRHVLSIALTTHFCNTLCKFSNSHLFHLQFFIVFHLQLCPQNVSPLWDWVSRLVETWMDY